MRASSNITSQIEKVLAKKYGGANVSKQRRSVTVDFPEGEDEERVMSVDVVPAFTKSDHYEIPDTATSKGSGVLSS